MIGQLVVLGMLITLALLLRFARSRAWLIRLGHGLSLRFGRPEHTAEWERENAELWLMARRRQLMADLRRIESLMLHDDWMSATRQLGNRLARGQLLASLARIPELVPAQDRYFGYDAAMQPASDIVAPASWASPRSSVEVLDVVGW